MKVLIIIMYFHLVPIGSLSCLAGGRSWGVGVGAERRGVGCLKERQKRELKMERELLFTSKMRRVSSLLKFFLFQSNQPLSEQSSAAFRQDVCDGEKALVVSFLLCLPVENAVPTSQTLGYKIALLYCYGNLLFFMQIELLMCMHMINSKNVDIVS